MDRGSNIYLIGLMGAGKSTVARELARRLGWHAVDTDVEVVRRSQRSIPEIFALYGEAEFRAREAAALEHISRQHHLVVATGGGIVLRPDNRERLRATGLVVYLQAEPEELYRRLARGGMAQRPLLQEPDPLGKLRALLAEREPLYLETAHLVVPTVAAVGPAAVAERIQRKLEEAGHGNQGSG